jgi:hypothetical protein
LQLPEQEAHASTFLKTPLLHQYPLNNCMVLYNWKNQVG